MSVATKLIHAALNWGALTGHPGVISVQWVTIQDNSDSRYIIAIKLNTVYPISSGNSLDFAADSLKITEGGSDTAVLYDTEALASLDARYGSGSPATFKFRLWSSPPNSDGTGGTEFSSAGNYTPKTLTNNTTNFPAASMV